MKVDVPIGLFHGERDGSTRVEGVREAEAVFRKAGKTNLSVYIYPDHDHDLNWTTASATDGDLLPFRAAFVGRRRFNLQRAEADFGRWDSSLCTMYHR